MAESVVLLGFALRFTGGTLTQALPFYAVGIETDDSVVAAAAVSVTLRSFLADLRCRL